MAGNWDVAKAFDTTSHVGILISLALIGIPRHALLGHWNGLRNRSTCIFPGEWGASEVALPSMRVMRGIPQGAVRSPLYYNVFANRLIRRNRRSKSGLDYRLLISPSLHHLLPTQFRYASLTMYAERTIKNRYFVCVKTHAVFASGQVKGYSIWWAVIHMVGVIVIPYGVGSTTWWGS